MESRLINKIIQLYDRYNLQNGNWISQIENNRGIINNLVTEVLLNEKLFWLKYYYIDSDIKSAKTSMYHYGIGLQMKTHELHMKSFPKEEIAQILLSDSPQLLEFFKHWTFDDYFQKNKLGGPTLFMHHYLNENLESAKKVIEEFHEYDLGKNTASQADLTYIKGIYNKDIDQIREGIETLLQPKVHHQRYHLYRPYPADIISYCAAAYTKFAWMMGHEIEIDHDLVPMELMPIEPLDKYEVKYFFLDGYEGEIPQSYLDWKKTQADPEPGPAAVQDDFVWDQNRYKTRQEAIVIEQAIEKGYLPEQDNQGNWVVYKEDDQGNRKIIAEYGTFT